MNRTYRPGEIILDSRGTWFVRRDGSFVPYDRRRARTPSRRRAFPADTREMVL